MAHNPDGSVQDRMPKAIQEAVFNGLFAYHPEYTRVDAPALAFYAFQEARERPHYIPPDVWSKWEGYVADVVKPFIRQEIERFTTETHRSHIVEMPDTNHYCFLQREDEVAGQMQAFLMAED